MIFGILNTLFIFSGNITFFTHGPFNAVAAIARQQPRGTPVYIVRTNAWGDIYFPLFYAFGGDFDPYLLDRAGDGLSLQKIIDGNTMRRVDDSSWPARAILVSATRWGADDIRNAILRKQANVEMGPTAAQLLADPRWHVVEDVSSMSFVAARILVIERAK